MTEVDELLELPEPPPQSITISVTRRKGIMSANFINAHPLGNQIRGICPTLQVAHVTPSFYCHLIGFYLLVPATMFTRGLFCRLKVLPPIGTEQLGEIGVDYSVPGDAEYYS